MAGDLGRALVTDDPRFDGPFPIRVIALSTRGEDRSLKPNARRRADRKGSLLESRPAAIGEVKVVADSLVTKVDLLQSKPRFWHICPDNVFAALVRHRLCGVAD